MIDDQQCMEEEREGNKCSMEAQQWCAEHAHDDNIWREPREVSRVMQLFTIFSLIYSVHQNLSHKLVLALNT